MNTNKQGREAIYNSRFKIAVAREYLTSQLGYGTLAKKYGLPGPETVSWFVKWYRKKYPDNAADTLGADAAEETSPPPPAVSSKELEEASLKITALEMLIENAGKELGIDLVKKFGTKQPKT